MTSCPRCGHPLAPDARICHLCGFLTAGADLPLAERSISDLPAGFWIRAAASAVDSVAILAMLFGLVFLVAVIGTIAGLEREPLLAVVTGAYYALGMPASIAYYIVLESSPRQATWGKRALGLYVQREDGSPVTRGRATGRFFGKFLSNMSLGVGYAMVGFTQRKQALHDLLAGTVVLRRAGVEPAKWAVLVAALTALAPAAMLAALASNPGLLQVPGAANETSAIDALRAINTAQTTFAMTCGNGGYAPSLGDLGRPPTDGQPFLAADVLSGEKDGYRLVLVAGSASTGVAAADQTCNGSRSVTSYHAIAVPVAPGPTARRSFATNESGTIYANPTADAIANPVPPGTSTVD